MSTTYTYNSAGDLIRTTYSDGTPEINRAYDRQGRPVQIADAAGVRTLHHDQGLTTAETMVSSAIPGLGGVILTRELDSFNRVSTIRVDSAASAEPAYLATHDYRHPESNLETGRLTRIAAGGLSHHFAYLPGSSLIREITSETTFGLARTEMRSYDSRNRLTAIATQTNGPGNRMFSYSYNRADQRLRTDREDGSYWEYTYDTYGQVVSGQKTSADNTPVPGHQLGYAYDAIGNRIRSSNGDVETDYDSNRLNQITHRRNPRQAEIRGAADPDAQVTVNNQPATRDGGYFSAILSAPPGDTPYPLDVDIEARLAGAGADGADAVATETGQILIPPGNQAFTYDADGNLTTDGLWNYTWNAENRLIAMEQQWQRPGQPRQRLTFTYDASGRRVAKAVYQEDNNDWTLKAHHTFLYDGWNLVWELTTTDTANTQKKYTWGIDLSGTLQGAGGVGGLLAVETTTAEASSLALPAYDGNGNIHAYTDAHTGQTLATWEYDPFGRQTRTTGDTQAFPHQFSTKYHDPETGLLYYGFRYYDPENGRWLNRDPIGEAGGLNLYGMVGNDPVNYIDVLGLNVYAIDGTNFDVQNNFGAGQTFSNVWDFHQRSLRGGELSRYFGGPASSNPAEGFGDAHGFGTYGVIDRVLQRIAEDFCADMKIKINIVGWSRGATAAVEVARRLKAEGIYCCNGKAVTRIGGGRNRGKPATRSANLHRPGVNFLGLYDAVEMVFNPTEIFPGDQGFPNSITNTHEFFHAMKTQNQLLFPTTDFGHPNQVAFNLNTTVPQVNRRGRPTGRMVPERSSHGDIGVNPSNSNAHREMVRRAKAAGVNIDTSGL